MYPWRTPYPYDGPQAPAPRRAELLGDLEDAWWADVTAWTEWAIATFRLSRWFPSCWLRHPALVEEAQALWLLWCEAWMPGTEPARTRTVPPQPQPRPATGSRRSGRSRAAPTPTANRPRSAKPSGSVH